MKIIDSHQHFWEYDVDRDTWITDEMKVIRRDFMPQDLKAEFDAYGVSAAVAVQADQNEKETEFLLSLSNEFEFIHGVVGWADLKSDDVQDRIAKYSQHEKFVGLRHILQGEQTDFFRSEDFRRGLRVVFEGGLSYDVLVYEDQLDEAYDLMKACDEGVFVIDHIAKPSIKEGSFDAWRKGMMRMSSMESVYCKISGLITEADWKNWSYDDLVPYLDAVVEIFGTDRLMYGSDWPVCLLAGSYGNVLDIAQRYFDGFSPEEKAAVFYRNCQKAYKLKEYGS